MIDNILNKIKQEPHWRVLFRPTEEVSIPSLGDCIAIVEKNLVSLRGWNYPHLSRDGKKREHDNNYFASWADLSSYEYWRLYLSGQFIHLFRVEEYCNTEYANQLKSNINIYLSNSERNELKNIKGFISITNVIYKMTEIFEFARRLSNTEYFKSSIEIEISLDLKGLTFALSDTKKVIYEIYKNPGKVLKYTNTLEKKSLPNEAANLSFKGMISFFQQFGWINVPEKIIKEDQEDFLAGRVR